MKKYAVVYVSDLHINEIKCSTIENAVAVRDILKSEGYEFSTWTIGAGMKKISVVEGIAEIAA